MDMIEPNAAALPPFALAASIAGLGFYVLAGAFPLSTRGDLRAHPAGVPLAVANAFAFLALLAVALAFGVEHLRWTSVVIVSGLAFLFAPAAFHLWPQRWRDGAAGLAVMLALTAAALAALAGLGGAT
jgi:hypothetical protein